MDTAKILELTRRVKKVHVAQCVCSCCEKTRQMCNEIEAEIAKEQKPQQGEKK